MPVSVGVVRQRIHGRHVHTPALGVAGEQPQDRHLGTHSLAGPGGGSDENVVIRVIKSVENLSLHRIELGECLAVQILVLLVAEGGHGQGLEVEQLGWRRILLREDEVAEADRQHGLARDPAVRDDADEILRRQRLEHRHEELDGVLVLAELLLQQEELAVNVLAAHVLHQDPECLLVMGWMWLTRSSLGNWCTYLWMVLPSFGILISSPISAGPRS